MRRLKSLASPGTVLGAIALIVALGGTSIAASGNGSSGGSTERAAAVSADHATAAKKKKKKRKRRSTLTTAKVKKIVAAEIKKEAPTLTVAKANTANTANTANSAKIATNVLSANVRPDGTLLGSIPAGATSKRTATGTYSVSFGRSIVGCTISATLASNEGPHPGMVGIGVIDANTLNVFVRSDTNTVVDLGTYVQAICPAS